jgi:hypothetical protein
MLQLDRAEQKAARFFLQPPIVMASPVAAVKAMPPEVAEASLDSHTGTFTSG